VDDKDLNRVKFQSAYDGECHFLGRSWDTVGNNETGLQFKESVHKKVSELLGENTKCITISEAW